MIIFVTLLAIWETTLALPVTPNKKAEEKKQEVPEVQKPRYEEEYDPNDPRAEVEVRQFSNKCDEISKKTCAV